MTTKIFFYIEEIDKCQYIGLSANLKRLHPDFINKCTRFCIDKENKKYAVNISLKSVLNPETFENITKSILQHFNNKHFNIFYKTGDEVGVKKYTLSNLKPKRDVEEPKKYLFIDDE